MGFGVEPLLETGQTHWESRTRDSACLIGKRRRVGELAAIPFKNDECLFCEPMCGSDEKICKAQALLETLEDDIKEQEEDIKDQREAGIESSAPLRAARYILYRKYVFAKEGFLGKRIRIRIAPCVVEAIRNRFLSLVACAQWVARCSIARSMAMLATETLRLMVLQISFDKLRIGQWFFRLASINLKLADGSSD